MMQRNLRYKKNIMTDISQEYNIGQAACLGRSWNQDYYTPFTLVME